MSDQVKITYRFTGYPVAVERTLLHIISQQPGDFGPGQEYLRRALSIPSVARIPEPAVWSIRMEYLKGKFIRSIGKTARLQSRISADYAAAMDIQQIARKYDVPAVRALKSVLGDGKAKLSEMAAKADYKTRTQARLAYDLDIFSEFDNDQMLKRSRDFERRIETLFHHRGISFTTEEETKNTQISEHGRAIATPDILLTTPITVNGHKVYWADAKSFYLLSGHFAMPKLRKQADRYAELWGPGIFIFEFGYTRGIDIKNAMITDYHHFVKALSENRKRPG